MSEDSCDRAALITRMSTFDEAKIRRGQPANAGQFAAKTHSAPVAKLTPDSGPRVEWLQEIHPGVTGVTTRDGHTLISITGDTLNNPGDDRPGYAPVVDGVRVIGEEARTALLDKHEELVRQTLAEKHHITIENKRSWNDLDLVLDTDAETPRLHLENHAAATKLHHGSASINYAIWDAIEKAEGTITQVNGFWHRHRPTTDDPFWREMSAQYDLDGGEQEALDHHLQDPATQEQIAGGAKTTQIIADSMKPEMLASRSQAERARTTLEARLGHDVSISHKGVLSVHGSTPRYNYRSATNGDAVRHQVGREAYATAEEIPQTYRKARAAAAALEQDVRASADVIALEDEARKRYTKWNLLDNA